MQIHSEDFKYVMLDSMKVYIGASLSYAELQKQDQTPFKLRAIIMSYMKNLDENLTIAEHLVSMASESMEHLTYRQLKCKVKFTTMGTRVRRGGKKQNETRVMLLDDFRKVIDDLDEETAFFVEEVSISKLSLMAFSV